MNRGNYKIYTSWYGICILHLAFLTEGEKVKYWTYSNKRGKTDLVYISLFQKHGLYKCKMKNKNSFEFYKGTQLLFWSSTFSSYKQLMTDGEL